MNIENHSILQHYIKLTEFLGRTLGPDYEIVLHSLEDKEKSIIAIANNHVSGQELGAPLASEILQIIADKSYHNYSYRTHYMGVSALGKKLRSSTLFIENTSEELIGLLSINFDDSKYVDLAKQLIGLCHPDTFVETNFRFDETYKGTPASQGEARSGEPGIRNASAHPMSGEAVPVSSGETVNEALSRIFRDMDLEGKSLSQSPAPGSDGTAGKGRRIPSKGRGKRRVRGIGNLPGQRIPLPVQDPPGIIRSCQS